MAYKLQDRVEAFRNIAKVDTHRRWMPGTIMGHSTNKDGSQLWRIKFDDYWRSMWYREDRLRPTTVQAPPDAVGKAMKHPAEHFVTVAPKAPPKPVKVLHDCCPKCKDRGEWRSLALVCRNGHGVFAG